MLLPLLLLLLLLLSRCCRLPVLDLHARRESRGLWLLLLSRALLWLLLLCFWRGLHLIPRLKLSGKRWLRCCISCRLLQLLRKLALHLSRCMSA